MFFRSHRHTVRIGTDNGDYDEGADVYSTTAWLRSLSRNLAKQSECDLSRSMLLSMLMYLCFVS